MEIILSKFLPLIGYPLGLVFILIIFALFVFKRPRLQRIILILALVLLWVASNRWVAMGLAKSLEWRYLPPDQIPQAEVVVVLGGGTLSHENPRPMEEVNSAGDRVIYAARLYKDGVAPNLLLSGGGIDWYNPESSPAQEMYILLELMGVPPEAMWLESDSRNTYENAAYTHQILESKGINTILLVTSAAHMHRSVKLFEAQGFEVIPLPTDYVVTETNWNRLSQGSLAAKLLYLVPGSDNLSLTTRILKEYLGILYYNLKGWL
jgi:uncharacterized SAM-binding protein YcdF (DUF218 family)